LPINHEPAGLFCGVSGFDSGEPTETVGLKIVSSAGAKFD
jgi:hypothetical protein